MKILLIITKADIGGAQEFVLTLARGLKNSGYIVSVAFGDGNFLSQELENEGIPYFRLENLKRGSNPFSAFSFIFELKSLINREKFDVIHFNSTNTLPGVISVAFSKIKIKKIFTVHGLSILDSNYKASFFIKLIFKFYFKIFLYFIDKIVFVSKYNLDDAKDQNITKKGLLIYNGLGIESNYFMDRDKAREGLENLTKSNLSDSFLIGSIGRLVYQKNYEFILKIWPEIKKIKPKAKIILIGEGPERNNYERIINHLNISSDIFLIGEIKKASQFIKAFDLFVLPSVYEGLSISLIEALFSGIPVLASDVGGNREVIGVENCFELNNDSEFLKKIEYSNLPNIDKSEFSSGSMINKYIEIYE